MKLPLQWLNDYVDISDISVNELQSKLFSCGYKKFIVQWENKNTLLRKVRIT